MEEVSEHIKDLIVSSLNGDIQAEEADELQSWICASEDHARYFYEWQDIWSSSSESPEFDVASAYNTFLSRIHGAKISARPQFRFLYYAAAIAVLLIVAVVAYRSGESMIKSNFSDIVVEAPAGSRLKLHLPDGTKVWLNSCSKLTYSQGFGVDDRTVSLSGEAYFEVEHREDIPFTVHSANLRVHDLGTKFDFCDYPEDAEATVMLTEGKVSLDNLRTAVTGALLVPGQKAVLDKQTGKLTVRKEEVKEVRPWKTGMLIFNGDALADIAKKLQRSYHVKVMVANDSLRRLRFYGEFNPEEQQVRDVLDALAATNKVRYRLKGSQVTFY